MSETFSSVPQVDFARLNDPSTRDEELKKLREAIFVVGFLYLINTGLEVGTLNTRYFRAQNSQRTLIKV
mgnify:CR=1 FL=1